MAFDTLVRRRTQLALLASACDQHEPVRLRAAALGRDATDGVDAALLTLAADGLTLDCIDEPVLESLSEGARVEGRFGHRGERFQFVSRLAGRRDLPPLRQSRRLALQVAIPLRIQRYESREHSRRLLGRGERIGVTVTSLFDASQRIAGQLRDASTGGFALVAQSAGALRAPIGAAFLAQFARIETHARLIHRQAGERTGETVLGFAIQPGDDAGLASAAMRRLLATLNHSPAGGEMQRC